MQRLWVFWAAFVAGFSGAIVPGPMLAATIHGSLQRGFWTGPLVVTGHALLEIGVVALLAFGHGTFLKQRRAFITIALIGGAMLVYMGVMMILDAGSVSIGTSGSQAQTRGGSDMLAGIVTSLSNPYFFLWWVTVGLALIQDAQTRKAGAAIFFAGHILSDYVWFALVSLGVSQGRDILPAAAFKVLFWVCGSSLIGLGIWFASNGARKVKAA